MDTLFVSGNSMKGILESGQKIEVEITKIFDRDDLVIFREHESAIRPSVKLCFGIPGDKININFENGDIYCNRKLAPVKLINDSQKYCWKDWLNFLKYVPNGYLFLLGTSTNAIDSRSRGFIHIDQTIGKVKKKW